jgi:transposase
MKAYSLDLRERIVAAAKTGQSHTTVAQRFAVTKTTVARFVRQFDQHQHLNARKPTGKPPRLCEQHWQQIEDYLAEHPNAVVAQVRTFLQDTLHITLSPSAVHDNLKRRGYTFKKRVWWRENETTESDSSSANASAR